MKGVLWQEAEVVLARCTTGGQLDNVHVICLGKMSKIISFATLNHVARYPEPLNPSDKGPKGISTESKGSAGIAGDTQVRTFDWGSCATHLRDKCQIVPLGMNIPSHQSSSVL